MRVKGRKTDLDAAVDVLMWTKENGRLFVVLRGRSEVIDAKLIPGATLPDEEIELEHQRSTSHKLLARALGHDV